MEISKLNTMLADLYLEYRNDFLTPARFAEYHCISVKAAEWVIDAGRECQDARAAFLKEPKAAIGKPKAFQLDNLAFPITLVQDTPATYTVTYGKQSKERLGYGQAASELGYSIMHALACDGKINN